MIINTENYKAETIIQELKQNSIETVLKKYNLTWKELFYIQQKKALYNDKKRKYITTNKRKNYVVMKRIDGKQVNYGEYKNKKDAEVIVNELKKVYWNKDKLDGIKLLTGICEYNE